MKKIIIVEDNWKRALSIAAQVERELQGDVAAVGIFSEKGEIPEGTEQSFEVHPLTLWNLERMTDVYREDGRIILMRMKLKGDGSDGIPAKMASIRYARKHPDYGALFLYTGAGESMHRIGCELVGKNRMLPVRNARGNAMELEFGRESFQNVCKDD